MGMMSLMVHWIVDGVLLSWDAHDKTNHADLVLHAKIKLPDTIRGSLKFTPQAENIKV